jgi:cytochrome c oxidase accessory protein FixG
MTVTLPTPPEDVLSTLNPDGSRRWLRPRLSPGRFLSARRLVGWALVVTFVTLPFVHIAGRPALLVDVLHWRMALFGKLLLPSDTILLAIFLVGSIVGLFLFTAMLGRVWCGWACPQTVYMELLFRPIERLFDGKPKRGGALPGDVSALRTVAKYVVFAIVSVLLANVFLSYFVGVASLRQWMLESPGQHPSAFFVMALTAALVFFDFVWFREQTCIVACPYGRFQSVLLDSD